MRIVVDTTDTSGIGITSVEYSGMFVADSYDEIQDFIKKLLIFEMNSREKTPTMKEAERK